MIQLKGIVGVFPTC